MKVVAVVACHGRLPLLKQTIQRLLIKNKVSAVVCVGSQEERQTCIDAGAMFIMHENRPLGKKWNAGFVAARELIPDALLFVGSSDWLSDNWLPLLLPYMKNYDLIGKPDYTMMDISETIRMSHWVGYGPGPRETEPIGIGRLVSARILNKIGWRPFDDNRNNSMDYMMFNKVAEAKGKIGMVESDHLVALSISTNKWPNMHKFEDHWNDKVPSKSHRIIDMQPYFKMFPEYKKIFK